MGFNAIHIDSAPGALVEQVLSQIEIGRLAPGTCLPSQRELARMFQVGLGTVREAIKILTVMGHMEVIRGKGTFVRNAAPTHDETSRFNLTASRDILQAASLSDLLKTRDIIECGAARAAAQEVCPIGTERLKKIGAGMSTKPEDIDSYYRNDFEFHLAVAEATNNRAILEMVHLLVNRVHHCLDYMDRSLGISLPLNIKNCVRSAREVIACIAAGEAECASIAMGAHLNVVRFQLDQIFLNQEPRASVAIPGNDKNILGVDA